MLDTIFAKIEGLLPEKWRQVVDHAGFRRYFANTGWMFFGQMFNLALSFFIGVWLARYLGPGDFGIINYALAFVGLFSFISELGLNNILSRELVKFPEKRDNLLGTALALKIIGGALAMIVTGVAVFWWEADPLIRLLVILYSLTFIFQALSVVSIFFQSRVEARRNVRAQMVSASLSSILKLVLIFSGAGLIWLMVIYVLDVVWLSLALLAAYRRAGFQISAWSFDWHLAKEMLANSWPLMLTGISLSIYMRLDQVMIKQMIDETAVGLYAVAAKLSEVWYIIPATVCPSLFAAIINARKTDQRLYFRRLKRLFWLMFILALLIGLPVTVLAVPLVALLFGSAYIAAAPILKIYIWSAIGTFLGVAVGQYLVAENYTKIYFWITIFGALSNIILNLVLIPRAGSQGAAWATVFSYLFVVLSLLFFRRVRRDLRQIMLS